MKFQWQARYRVWMPFICVVVVLFISWIGFWHKMGRRPESMPSDKGDRPKLDWVRKVSLNSQKVLVTGGAGFIGFHLLQRLYSQNISAVGLDVLAGTYSVDLKRERKRRLSSLGITVHDIDVCDRKRISHLLAAEGFTTLVHLAAYAGVRNSILDPEGYVDSNIACFTSLLNCLTKYPHIYLVYASSSSIYGRNTKVPFAEEDSVANPASVYAASKRADELLAHVFHHQYGIRSAGLRFFTVYGPWGRPDMAYFNFAQRIVEGKPITLYQVPDRPNYPMRDFTYVDDIIDGVVSAMIHQYEIQIFNLGNNNPVSLNKFVGILETLLERNAIKEFKKMPSADVPITFADLRHSEAYLGYVPKIPLERGLGNFINWFKSSEYLPRFANDSYDGYRVNSLAR